MDAVLDGLTPEQFDEWIAYRQIEADPFERLMKTIKIIGLYVIAALGGKDVTFEDLDPTGPDDEKQHKASPREWQSMMRARGGKA